MSEKITAAKEAAISVAKSKGLGDLKAKVVLAMDYSGSMDPLYTAGFVQRAFERIVPLALAFTPDKSMPCYIFSSGFNRVLPDVTESNVHNYVQNNIRNKYSYGMTEYAPVMRAILNQVIKENTPGGTTTTEDGKRSAFDGIKSFFGGGPKKPAIEPTTADIPTLVIFITDGDNNTDDKPKATAAIVEAAKHSIFWQFWGLSHSKSDKFAYLEKLDTMSGRYIDNANLMTSSEETFDNLTDDQLYTMLLGEFPSWYKEAQTKEIFKLAPQTVAP